LVYLVGVPLLVLWGGYRIYLKNASELDDKAARVKKIEENYLSQHPENMVKLQNFNKKVFAIGVYDDIMIDKERVKIESAQEDWKLKIVKNSQLIRNVIKDLQAENVVLELCDERYEEELTDILANPNYDRTLAQVHTFLDSKPERLLKYDQISVDSGNFEILVGLDTCTYRTPCKTILGDRNFSITQKRFQAKLQLLNLYKE
jgi:hypothetical protein